MNANFETDAARQRLDKHTAALRRHGYEPRNIADACGRLRDLWCPVNDTFFECKSENHPAHNVCVEIVSNVPADELPQSVAESERVYTFEDERYGAALDWLRDVFASQHFEDNKNRLALCLSPDLEQRHFYSAYFCADDAHYLFPLRAMQQLVCDGLRARQFDLVWKRTCREARCWVAMSALVPLRVCDGIRVTAAQSSLPLTGR